MKHTKLHCTKSCKVQDQIPSALIDQRNRPKEWLDPRTILIQKEPKKAEVMEILQEYLQAEESDLDQYHTTHLLAACSSLH